MGVISLAWRIFAAVLFLCGVGFVFLVIIAVVLLTLRALAGLADWARDRLRPRRWPRPGSPLSDAEREAFRRISLSWPDAPRFPGEQRRHL